MFSFEYYKRKYKAMKENDNEIKIFRVLNQEGDICCRFKADDVIPSQSSDKIVFFLNSKFVASIPNSMAVIEYKKD